MLFLFGSAALMLLTSTTLVAQGTQSTIVQTPFGFHIGQPKEKITTIAMEVGPHRFLLESVPKPDPVLEIYSVVVTPKAGLCSIRALSPDLKTTPEGTELKSVFVKMVEQLERQYGKPDTLIGPWLGSTLTKPTDWMAGLLKKEQAVFAIWPTRKLPATTTLSRVTVSAVAVSETVGYIAVQYYFTNYDQCQQEIITTAR